MTAYTPAYELTVYAPRSVDATEATVLTPIGGAAHSDPFVLTTIQGVSGTKPYLDFPRGQQGSIDPLTKKTTVGNLTVRAVDQRVTAGGSNAVRWITAFIGDALGKQRLIGCKARLRESLDGGSSWSNFFMGRVFDVGIGDNPQWVEFSLRSMADDLSRRVFIGAPHPSIAYAFQPSLVPIGLPKAYGNFLPVAPIPATVTQVSSTRGYLTVASGVDPWSLLLTPLAWAQLWTLRNIRVTLTVVSGGATGQFLFGGGSSLGPLTSPNGVGRSQIGYGDGRVGYLEALPVGAPGYLALPANGTAVTFSISTTDSIEPSKTFPLLVSDVHPVQLWADLLDGKFSLLQSDGSARAIVARDSSAFSALIADTSFPSFRTIVEQPDKASDFIERAICQPYQLGYRLDGDGRVIPIDLRRSSTITAGGTITDADLVTGPAPAWKISRQSAITAVSIDYYEDWLLTTANLQTDTSEPLAFPSAGIAPQKRTLVIANDISTLGDIGEHTVKIDARGVHLQAQEVRSENGHSAAVAFLDRLIGWAQDMLAPYSSGGATLPLRCRRTSVPASTYQGQWRTVNVTTQPNAASNQRGGARLMLCTSRSEDGAAIVLEFLDAGDGSVAVAPSITSIAVASDDPGAVEVAVTLNAAGQRATVWYGVTAAGTGARPADTDAQWLYGGFLTASGTLRIRSLPARARIWLRARSEPTGQAPVLPSVWAYPGGSGYVDTAGLTAPSSVTTSNVFANRADVAWTVGDATRVVEVYLTAGSVPGTWTESMKVAALPPGANKVRVFGLSVSSGYALGVRHRDDYGGTSTMATATFTSGATPGVAPRPAGLDFAVRPSA